MTTLVLSTRSLPAAKGLEEAARNAAWDVHALADDPPRELAGRVVFYVETDIAWQAAKRFHAALLEPSLDLLAKLPLEFRRRAVEFVRFAELARLKAPTFVKPADPLNKVFDAGIYDNRRDIRTPHGIDPATPVLIAEPVEWTGEYRCFIQDGKLAAWSPYLSFGRPTWKAFRRGQEMPTPATLTSFCNRLLSRSGVKFPPAFVVDVGPIEERGWAVVEFNPVWCAGLLGADPRRILPVLERACRNAADVTADERPWVLERA